MRDPRLHFVAQIPSDAGRVVGIVSWRDRVIVATEYGNIYTLVDKGDNSYEFVRTPLTHLKDKET